MRITTKCDQKGRLYLCEAIRDRYGEEFVLIELPDGLLLRRVPEDPVADLEKLGSELEEETVEELKRAIEEQAEEEVG